MVHPPHIFKALGLIFDLDPCSAGVGKDCVPALNRFTIRENGLAHDWFGTVWCNPPYGSATKTWLKRMQQHGDGIALVFARTGTRWWHEVVPSTTVICFIAGRLSFINSKTGMANTSAGADSVLLTWGTRSAAAVTQSNLGLCCRTV